MPGSTTAGPLSNKEGALSDKQVMCQVSPVSPGGDDSPDRPRDTSAEGRGILQVFAASGSSGQARLHGHPHVKTETSKRSEGYRAKTMSLCGTGLLFRLGDSSGDFNKCWGRTGQSGQSAEEIRASCPGRSALKDALKGKALQDSVGYYHHWGGKMQTSHETGIILRCAFPTTKSFDTRLDRVNGRYELIARCLKGGRGWQNSDFGFL